MRRAVLLAASAAVLLSACVAESVERRRPRKGPVKEVGYVDLGGGSVRYSLDGWSWFVKGRRRHARRLMRKNCGKDLEPRVVDEYARQDADAPYVGDDLAVNIQHGGEHYKIEPFIHLVYECRLAGSPEVMASTAPARMPLLVIPPVLSSTSTVPSLEPSR
ncbi:MAG TPA: hypothetical protein DCZ01_02795 [Elusimicrobia bacterium]|nr:MAG: hypothetical protein A2X37_05425 [Elusimicrobia bacterium GWA2_66_18]OGR69173.1 MAG: hypothetical protein A2X40_07145 [Elusimicrobia bacterium GWC2_65_9]HAZ07458.1 hypothetical protein [Elusimicrobiota bacterium]